MKKALSILLSLIIVVALFGCSKEEEAPTTTTETTTVTTTQVTTTKPAINKNNPLTNDSKFDKKAVGVRPVAIVVENLTPARPQWGIETPDIIVEGEVEGGISRMLWLYADFTKVPDKVGPIRSARPSFVKFSELFDSIYIHWGGSHSKGNYVGGYTVIWDDHVGHIDGMKGGKLFGRDTTRSTSSEHRGIIHGNLLPEVIKEKEMRTDILEKKFTRFSFNDNIIDAGTINANSISQTFSSRTDTRKFTYNEKDKKYHTNDWKADVSFQNVVTLMDDTEYITTPYKGGSTTYLNYTLKSGSGYYASNGKATKIKWAVKDRKLVLTDEAGNELKLNTGNSYIGLTSSNHNGKVTFA